MKNFKIVIFLLALSIVNVSLGENIEEINESNKNKGIADQLREKYLKEYDELQKAGKEERKKWEAERKEKIEFMNKVISQGITINRGVTSSGEHVILVKFKQKIYNCRIYLYAGGCTEVTGLL